LDGSKRLTSVAFVAVTLRVRLFAVAAFANGFRSESSASAESAGAGGLTLRAPMVALLV